MIVNSLLNKTHKDSQRYIIFKGTILFLYIMSMYPWFSWNINPVYITVLGAFVVFSFLVLSRKYFIFSKKNLFADIILILSFLYLIQFGNINNAIALLSQFFVIFIVLNTSKRVKHDLVSFVTTVMSIIVGISLFFYILYLLGFSLPHSRIMVQGGNSYDCDNYYFFVIGKEELTDYFRFRGIWAEPGHITMGIIPLLYINRLNLKRVSVLILFIGELFTLSLAGYISISFIILFTLFSSKYKIFTKLILFILFVICTFITLSTTKESIFQKAIINRLQFEDNSGKLENYSRTSGSTDSYFENMSSNEHLFGLNNRDLIVNIKGAGYKIYLLYYGIFGMLLVIVFYLSIAFTNRNAQTLGFFILLMILLYQNAYPYWYSVIFAFILGVSEFRNYPRNKEVRLKKQFD